MATNEEIIAKLNPIVAYNAGKLLKQCAAEGLNIRITQGLRTFAEQEALYNQGRTTAGQIVTNAKAGYSYHNYGLAFDFCLIVDGKAVWNETLPAWKRIVTIAKELGFAWGGDWIGFKDYPHFEMSFGFSTAQLRAGAKVPTKVEEEFELDDKIADYILIVLGDYWHKMNGNSDVQEYTHYVANELRKALGRPTE